LILAALFVVGARLVPFGAAGGEADESGGISADAGDAGIDAADGGAKACVEPKVIEVETIGTFTGHADRYRHLPDEPAVRVFPTTPVRLAHGYFAADFSIADLCSAEEASPSHIRLVCLGYAARPFTIEYRVGSDHIVKLIDGKDSGETPIPVFEDGCARLETKIPKRDLTPLVEAYLDDRPSERCAASKAPRRRVAATLVRHIDADSIANTPCSKTLCCYEYTGVRLAIPLPRVGPTQDMGRLDGQCSSICSVSRMKKPKGVSVHCSEGGTVRAYQLGDALYIVEDEHVRRVPLPCGVELDFHLNGFASFLVNGRIFDD